MPKMSTRRKLAIATWSSPREGNIYGKLTVDATLALEYIAAVRAASGQRVTITHFVGKAVALALAKAPGLNGFLRFGAYHQHERVSLAFLVALEEGADLAKAKVDDLDKKSLVELAEELKALATKLRAGKDETFEKSKGMIRLLPTWLLRPILAFTGWVTSSLGINMQGLGAFPFGSCVVTSVGMFGLDEGYAPPTPFARVPLYVLLGALRDAPAVVDGQLAVRKQLTITATIDHRFLDGYQGGVLARTIRETFENPEAAFGPIPSAAQPTPDDELSAAARIGRSAV